MLTTIKTKQIYFKKFNIDPAIKIKYYKKYNNHFIIFKRQTIANSYIQIPMSIILIKTKNYITFKPKLQTKYGLFDVYLFLINFYLEIQKNIELKYYKSLILRGMGYKMNLLQIDNNNFLDIKIGYSNIIRMPIPTKNISITISNSTIHILGNKSYKVGNFIEKIKKLRKFNYYTGKGFWHLNNKIILKNIKKYIF